MAEGPMGSVPADEQVPAGSSVPSDTPAPADDPVSIGRASRRRARWVIGAIALLLGVGQGVVWSQIAPGQQVKVLANGSYVTLPTTDYHPFVDLMISVLAGAVVGAIVAVAAWRVRAIRGTATLLTVFASTALGAIVAASLGLMLATGIDPASVGNTGIDSIVVAAPKLSTPLALVAEPLVAVLVYTFLVAWDGRPDLGRVRASAAAAGGELEPHADE